MVKCTGALIEATGMPRIRKAVFIEIEVMTELMTERAHKGSVRSDFLAHRRSHPHPDQPRVDSVVAKKFDGAAFTNSQWPLLTRERHTWELRRMPLTPLGSARRLCTLAEACAGASGARINRNCLSQRPREDAWRLPYLFSAGACYECSERDFAYHHI